MHTQNKFLDEMAGLALKTLGHLDKAGASFQKIKDLCDMAQRIEFLEKEVSCLSKRLDDLESHV